MKRSADDIARDVLMGSDRDRAELAREVLELNTLEQANYLRRLFRATGNALIAWQMFALYRRAGLPIPEDVLRMLDRFGEALQTASGPKEIAQALGMTGDKGGAQGAAALAKAKRHLHLVTDVAIRMEHDKTLPAGRRWGPERIFAQVARDKKLSVGAVRAAWRRHTGKASARQTRDTAALIAAALRPSKIR